MENTLSNNKIYPDFFIDQFLEKGINILTADESAAGQGFSISETKKFKRFNEVCNTVKAYLDKEFKELSDNEKKRETDLQKHAIIGEQKAVKRLVNKIKDALISLKLSTEGYPDYYRDLGDAVFNELYGYSGIAPWINDYTKEYARSSSAKLIGKDLYCLIDGKSVKQPQVISDQRREQLRRSLLLNYPKERLEAGHNEVFLQREDGSHVRVTLMSGDFTYPGKDVIVFRKYLMSDPSNLTFENLASYGTFPKECCDLFKALVNCGPNIFFCGEVRSGKTTFLQTWQHYEDPTLEGTTVSSDEETDYAAITKGPLVQVIADANKLDQVEKSLKRLDSNYIILSEVRTAAEYRFFLGITNMGTRRCKCTIHDNSAINFPYKMATEIVSAYGGNQEATISQLYSNIDYVFELYEVPTDRSKKRLKGIVELRYDPVNDLCSAHRICKYDAYTDTWSWKCDIGQDKKDLAMGYEEHFNKFISILKELERQNPLQGETVVYPAYYAGNHNKLQEDK